MPLLTTRAGASAGAFGFGGAIAESSSYVLLNTTTVTSGTLFTISNIPNGYYAYSVIGSGNHWGTNGADLSITPKNSSGTSYQPIGKGMHSQTWTWNMAYAGGGAQIAEKANNGATHFFEQIFYGNSAGYDNGNWYETTWGNSTTIYWKFGGGRNSSPGSASTINQMTFELYQYPSTPSIRELQVKLYGIKAS